MPENDAEALYNRCLEYGVSINLRNKRLYKTCGLRIGTQEISEILRDIRDNDDFSQDISDRINILSKNKKICYTIENECYNFVYNQLHHS